jgi:hypothetical protein
MSDVTADLRSAFADAGYGVDDVTDNRGRIEVSLRDDDAPVDDCRAIVNDVCGADSVVGFDVTSDTTAGDQAVGTVVAFRHRP